MHLQIHATEVLVDAFHSLDVTKAELTDLHRQIGPKHRRNCKAAYSRH